MPPDTAVGASQERSAGSPAHPERGRCRRDRDQDGGMDERLAALMIAVSGSLCSASIKGSAA